MWKTHPNDYWAFSKMADLFITHSLVLHFPRWRLSQISHSGTFPTHVHFTKSNSRGLPPPRPSPILGQTIDRCINIPLYPTLA